ncbi:D-alanyl-D-alanine carboxypeptidase [Hyphococcus sp.]|uniref:D-alanyl-D-alanine carboxypeptidase n=1 Tax=Hyphococcus sp. TaxID=2038636 RepID=UPI003D10A42B
MLMGLRSVSIWVAALFLALIGFAAPAAANSKYAAYVVHADSGDVLFDRYSTGTRYPASLTKMMTLYLLFDELEAGRLSLDSKISVSAHAAGQPPSKLGVTSGSTIDVETAIEALVVKSANDVAAAVAEQISGSEWRFAQKMTAKARELGMYNTTFRNASGLPNSKQVTTARDMATLGRRLIQDHEKYFPYFSVQSFEWDGRTYRTHNALVKTFQGADGLKTGYTRRSGFNLVTSATRDGNRLIGVVLGGRSSATRDAHMREILTNAYAQIEKRPLLISSLHRETPSPRLKPTLVAALAEKNAVPTIAANEDMRAEILTAAAAVSAPDAGADSIAVLIAKADPQADPDDFNEFERTRLASFDPEGDLVGQGDTESLAEYAWSIQIGAYSTKEMAQRELEAAVMKSGMKDRERIVLPTPMDGGKTLYRARITRLSEIEAAAGCETLKDKKISCFVVSDGGLSAGASAVAKSSGR